MCSGRRPYRLLSRMRTSWPPTLVKMTLRMVLLRNPVLARLVPIWAGSMGAVAQVSTQPELLAEATVSGFGVRPTTAPVARAAAARARATYRSTRPGLNIRLGPPGDVTAAPRQRGTPRGGSRRGYRAGDVRGGNRVARSGPPQ